MILYNSWESNFFLKEISAMEKSFWKKMFGHVCDFLTENNM